MTSLVFAIVAGFSMAFLGSMPPTGPIAVLVLERGVTRRYREGRALAVGAALPEGFYAALAVFGASALVMRFPVVEWGARIVGVVVLVVLGVAFARYTPADPKLSAEKAGDDEEARGMRRAFFLGFWIAAANPTLVLTWSTSTALLLSLSGIRFTLGDKLAFATAVTAGMTVWLWVMLALIRRRRDRVTVQVAKRIIRAAGWVMLGMALFVGVATARRAGL